MAARSGTSKEPRYRRLAATFGDEILPDAFGENDPLPTERALTKTHGLSRGLVYREPGKDQPRQAQPSQDLPDPRLNNTPRQHLDVDEARLFRFSALTLNARRIHYDH